jgi:hypothetical protein
MYPAEALLYVHADLCDSTNRIMGRHVDYLPVGRIGDAGEGASAIAVATTFLAGTFEVFGDFTKVEVCVRKPWSPARAPVAEAAFARLPAACSFACKKALCIFIFKLPVLNVYCLKM